MFGEKVPENEDSKRVKGWFPRCCVVEVSAPEDEVDQVNDVQDETKKDK
jgi:hypothetical protein